MDQNINSTQEQVVNTPPVEIENKEISQVNTPKQEIPKKAIKLEDGTIITNLKITYKNLFDFQRSYAGAKDLMEALVKKQTFDHETMVQLIYVAYLGTNPENKMGYFDFIDSIDFDYKRDLLLFKDLVGVNAEEKN